MHRRRTEVDPQIGEIIAIGRGRSIALPLNARLVEIIHDLETGRRQMSPGNL